MTMTKNSGRLDALQDWKIRAATTFPPQTLFALALKNPRNLRHLKCKT